jgi:hypothetical protein
MSRIRSIKPEFWTSAQVIDCAPITRLFFIGLWNFCDDHGHHPANEKQLKALIFPGDDIDLPAIRKMVDELLRAGLLTKYDVDNKAYLFVTGWHHQKIDRVQPSKFPYPDGSIRRSFDECAANGIDGREGKGRDLTSQEEDKIDSYNLAMELESSSDGNHAKNVLYLNGGKR